MLVFCLHLQRADLFFFIVGMEALRSYSANIWANFKINSEVSCIKAQSDYYVHLQRLRKQRKRKMKLEIQEKFFDGHWKICKDSVMIIAEQSIIFMVNMIPSLTITLSFFLNNDMKRAFRLQIHSCCADHILKFWVGLAIIDSQGLHS